MANASSADDAAPLQRPIAALRAAIAAACLATTVFQPGPHWTLVAAATAFTLYSLAALAPAWGSVPGGALLGLVVQTVFFLVLATFGVRGTPPLAAAVYFHLMLATMLFHPWWDTAVAAAAANAFLLLFAPPHGAALLPVAAWLGLLAVTASIVKSRAERSFREILDQERAAKEAALAAAEAERHRLAGDFHDGPLQAFTGIQLRLEVLRKMLENKPELAMEELRAVQELARSHTAEMRAFLRGIRPVEVGEAGLASSVRQVVADFQKHAGLAASFESHGTPPEGSEQRWAELVQIVREALTNVQKHARASRVAVALRCDRNQVEISIADDGAGFPFSGKYTLEELELLHRGPFSIERRVRLLGGKLFLDSRPGRGSTLTVQVGG